MGQAGGKGSPPSGVRSLQKDHAWSHVPFQVEYTPLGIVPGTRGNAEGWRAGPGLPPRPVVPRHSLPCGAHLGEAGSLGGCRATAAIDRLINGAFSGAGKGRK